MLSRTSQNNVAEVSEGSYKDVWLESSPHVQYAAQSEAGEWLTNDQSIWGFAPQSDEALGGAYLTTSAYKV